MTDQHLGKIEKQKFTIMSIIEEVLATREKMNVSFTIKSDDLDYEIGRAHV